MLKFKKLGLIIFILFIIFSVSSVHASDLNESDIADIVDDDSSLEITEEIPADDALSAPVNDEIYVDDNAGSDLNDGKSKESPVKSLTTALNLAGDNASIYVADGNYNGLKNTKISISKSVNVVGSNKTTFDGSGSNFIFNVSDNVKVTFKNINFANAFKQNTYANPTNMYGAALEINNATVLIDGCSFIGNTINYDSSINKFNYGGAISNKGDLTIMNSYFDSNLVASTSGLYSYGGAIYNKGKLLINSTIFNNSATQNFGYGGAIYNDGTVVMDRSAIVNSFSNQESKGSAIYNAGKFYLYNSIIENNTICRANFYYIYGAIYNYGELTGHGNIFRNNSGIYEAPNPEYKGSPNIFNVGYLNLTYNAFIDNAPFNGIASDIYHYGGELLSLEDNWWSSNDNPYLKDKINIDEKISSWFVLNLLPDYSSINIGQTSEIIAFWSLTSTLTPKINLFPVLNITFTSKVNDNFINVTKELLDGQASLEFNYSQKKGLYELASSVGQFSVTALIDIGKVNSSVSVDVADNILYTDDLILTVNVTGGDGNVPTGEVLVTFNKNNYVVNLTNGVGTLNLSKIDPGQYAFKISYEGSDSYFKSFEYANVTVNKAPVNLTVEFADIKIDQKGTVYVNLGPNGVQGQAYLYVNGVRKKVLYLYNGENSFSLSNFAEGQYNVTVEFWGTKYYESATVSTTFKVSKYDTSLDINVTDIKIGENETIKIKVSPANLQGEAILKINNVKSTIFLDGEVTEVVVSNLGYGTYDVEVYFPENQKYYAAVAYSSFKVSKTYTNLTVTIEENELDGKITVKTNHADCTGEVGVYVNFRLYTLNLTNGKAQFNVKFDKGTNYIYIYYDGDDEYEPSTWNTTLGVAEEFLLVGLNSSGFKYNDFNYTVHLIETTGIPMPNRVVSVSLNNRIYEITTNQDGIANLLVCLDSGIYEVSATYKNQTVFNTLSVGDVEFTVEAKDIEYGLNETVRVEFNKTVKGKVLISLNATFNKTADIKDGIALVNLTDLKVGTYCLKVIYFNDNFTSDEKTLTFNVFKADAKLRATVRDLVYGDDGVIRIYISEDATGNLYVSVDGSEYTRIINEGYAEVSLSGMDKGMHNVSVRYDGDSNYNNSSLKAVFYVKDAYSDIIITANDVEYGQNITVIARLNETATGNVTFNVSGIVKTVDINNGLAVWTFTGLNAGNYTVYANYLGDSTFISSDNSTSLSISKTNSTIDLNVMEVYLNENILIYAVLNPNATGSVSFSMINYYSPRLKLISNSIAVWYISPLNTGNYTIIASYAGDNNYYGSTAYYYLNITQIKAILTVDIADAGINDKVTIKAKLATSDGTAINGTVYVTIDSKQYRVNIYRGSGTLVLGRIDAGNYTFTAVYEGNDEFSKATVKGSFKVVDDLLNLKLKANDLSYYYGNDKSLAITALDDNNKPVSDVDLVVKIAGKTYTRTTDANGEISLPLSLKVGNYTAEIIFNENSRYHSAYLKTSIEIKTTIESINLVKLYGSSSQYFAMFVDSKGKALANADVVFKVGSKSYTVKTFINGVTRINFNYPPGKYSIIAINPSTGQQVKNSIFVFQKLMENKDITKYFGTTQVYKVRAYDDNGNPASGKTVTFKVNGKTYKVKTNSKGYATLKLKLKPKTYKITSSFSGFKVSNKIKVKKVLTAKSIKVKKGKVIKFKAKLVNTKGKALKGKKITFKFKGKTYKVKTNKKGIATLKLKLKLKVGKHKIKTRYGKSSIANYIRIKK